MVRNEVQPQSKADDVWIDAAEVRRRCGDIGRMTLYRWRTNPALSFPQPKVVNGRHFWRARDIADWQARQPEAA